MWLSIGVILVILELGFEEQKDFIYGYYDAKIRPTVLGVWIFALISSVGGPFCLCFWLPSYFMLKQVGYKTLFPRPQVFKSKKTKIFRKIGVIK